MQTSANAPLPLRTRLIPADQRPLPILGLGTWARFADDGPTRQVLGAFVGAGGRLIDSSPMYGDAEVAVGTLVSDLKPSEPLFTATKVWTTGREPGRRQIDTSIARMGHVDLLQIHNLLDWKTHIETLRALQSEGRIRYVGLTHYQDSAHAELERLITRLKPEFIQVNLSIADRHAETRLLPMAADAGVAVLINRPFEEGALFESVRGLNVPDAAKELGLTSWAQVFLAFVMAHPAVTCVLAATKQPHHLEDNLQAARLPALTSRQREQLRTLWTSATDASV
ncbi:aldo/keto reductase [Ahniella affigens]|uniref:Aldo/keto reductase n=2 Tax=Ahniella affigens TaxID=2021234 RepID=A0A2P1PZA7_9GAMM|nr:aldo/keto reductase [Ahniella affigens]